MMVTSMVSTKELPKFTLLNQLIWFHLNNMNKLLPSLPNVRVRLLIISAQPWILVMISLDISEICQIWVYMLSIWPLSKQMISLMILKFIWTMMMYMMHYMYKIQKRGILSMITPMMKLIIIFHGICLIIV